MISELVSNHGTYNTRSENEVMKNTLLAKLLVIIVGTCVFAAWPMVCSAQFPSKKPTMPNLFPSSVDGETVQTLGNYWDGVDDDNNLHVVTGPSLILDDVGKMRNTAIPPYPNFVDMNDDGLKDLVVGDTFGFLWIFLNSGEKGKPKFTTGKFMHTFIGWASKIHVTDWDGDGDYDVIIGTFYGDVVVLKNIGSRKEYKFTKSMGIPRYVDPQYQVQDDRHRLPQIMMKKGSKTKKYPLIVGNYMSPWVADWNKDGNQDLILGEGTYSANSVRLAVNVGSSRNLLFNEDRMHFMAFGEGYEQLVPAVVDYNGDGTDDLIVGTRTGHIRLHKGTKQAVEGKDFVAAIRGVMEPAILEYAGNLRIGGVEVYDKMSNVYPCDWNEDGLFDLLMGSTKGKIMIALNKGTKEKPLFPNVEFIKGTNTDKDLLTPSGWWSMARTIFDWYFVGGIGNSALLFSAEKQVTLKSGTQPIIPVDGKYFAYFRYVKDYPGWTTQSLRPPGPVNQIGARIIAVEPGIFRMVIGERYEFNFHSILKGGAARWKFQAWELVQNETTGKWGYQYREVNDTVNPSSRWHKQTKKFKCPGTYEGKTLGFRLVFYLPTGDCKFLLDNFSLREVSRHR